MKQHNNTAMKMQSKINKRWNEKFGLRLKLLTLLDHHLWLAFFHKIQVKTLNESQYAFILSNKLFAAIQLVIQIWLAIKF